MIVPSIDSRGCYWSYNPTNEQFSVFVSKQRVFIGNIVQSYVFLKKMGVTLAAIDIAADEMDTNGHTKAHFSMWGGFLFTEPK